MSTDQDEGHDGVDKAHCGVGMAASWSVNIDIDNMNCEDLKEEEELKERQKNASSTNAEPSMSAEATGSTEVTTSNEAPTSV